MVSLIIGVDKVIFKSPFAGLSKYSLFYFLLTQFIFDHSSCIIFLFLFFHPKSTLDSFRLEEFHS